MPTKNHKGGDVNYVFEGIGRVGKTTIINKLRELEPNRRHMKLGPWDKISRMFWDFSLFLLRLRENTLEMPSYIIDRGHISEMAYGPVYFPERYVDTTIMNHMRYIDRSIKRATDLIYGHRETVIVYIEPVNCDVLLPDKRCGTSRNLDLAAFRGAIAQTQLRVINLKTQEPNGEWRCTDNVIDELMERTSND